MNQIIRFIAVITLSLMVNDQVQGNNQDKTGGTLAFAVADVHFEQNATDGDVEVVFEVKGGDEGLAKLTVLSPDGRKVVDIAAPDPSTMGIRQFRFESPEPRDIAGLKAAYPEGAYTFDGLSVSGDKFHGQAKLNHRLPATVDFIQPGSEEDEVNIVDLELTWSAVAGLDAYTVELDQEDLKVNLLITLPGTVTSFVIPDNFLSPETEYKLSIGTRTADGNLSVVETTFTTAAAE